MISSSTQQWAWSSTTWSMATQNAHGRLCVRWYGAYVRCRTWVCRRGVPIGLSSLGTSHRSYLWWASLNDVSAHTICRRHQSTAHLDAGQPRSKWQCQYDVARNKCITSRTLWLARSEPRCHDGIRSLCFRHRSTLTWAWHAKSSLHHLAMLGSGLSSWKCFW
jgi:hypothetical protein